MGGTENNAEQRADGPVLSDAKAALLAKWVRGGRRSEAGIPRRAEGAPAPLSFAQQRLWFLHRLHPESAAYNMVNAYRLRGDLDLPALEAALSGVVRRHEALRTTFETRDGEPVQVVRPAAPVPLPLHDLAGLPADGRAAERERHEREEVATPVDLERGPILRARLLRLAPDDHELLVTVHHVAFDEGSELRFQHELAALYAAGVEASGDAATALPEPPVQYADYAAWQRRTAEGTALDAHLAYWRDRLDGLAPLDLPTDRPRPAEPSLAGDMHAFRLPRDLGERFRALCRAEDVTLHMGLLAAFQTLLHRYSGQDDLAVGSPASGRTRAETEDLVGFFVNTLVLRADFTDAPSFREVLARTRRTCLDAYAHQEVPFERVVEHVRPERDPGRTPLFQALFSLQNTADAPPWMPGLDLEARFVVSPTSKFDLSLYLLDDADGMRGWLEYSTDLFDAATARRMGTHLEHLLRAACDEPDRPVARLAMLPDDERAALLAAGAPAHAPAETTPETVHDWFHAVAQDRPDRTAVRMDDAAVSYAALDARADAVAATLQSAGVGPGAIVALCAERSPDLPAAVLGILRTGASYLPLDPAYPRDRLALMLEDSGAGHLLVEPGLEDTLPPSRATVVPFPAADAAGTPEPVAVGPSDAAYVLYTSGSTGRPKGTPIHHGALVNLLAAMRTELDVAEDDALLSVTTLSFDIGTMELLLPLVAGATLRIVGRETARDPHALLAALPGATLMQATPATWRMLVDAGWPELPAAERRLRALSGGEPLAPDLASAVLRRASTLWNGYGPTETTIYSTLHRVQPADLDAPRVPIGRPLAGTRARVLDAHGAPVPTGVPGELHLGGVGLSTGYLGRPELTAERFVPDPHSEGERLYRTGDLVRWLPDGTLDFLGRIDRQVKVRGFRIEPGEVEAALRTHESVAQAVVSVDRTVGDARLVAYVVPDADADPDLSDLPGLLRTHLAGLLPAHMVPAAFVTLDRIPLLPNGKTDASALPAPDGAHLARDAAFEPPRTATERLLADLWSRLLGVERIGRGDGFFSLGGHSLLAARLVSQVQEATGVALPLRVLFATPRLQDVARAVDDLRDAPGAAPSRPVTALPDRDGLPLSPAQERMWFLHRMDPESPAYNMAFAHRLRGPLDEERLRGALASVVARHEALRTRVREVDGAPVQDILSAAEAAVPFTLHDLTGLPAGERGAREKALLDEAAARSFDLEHGPVLRAALVRADDESVLLLVLHHFAFDERSHDVLLRDLCAAYDGARLDAPALQYGDFSSWQREAGTDESALEAWSERLRDLPALDLPAERTPPAARTFHGGHLELDLPDARERLLTVSRDVGATPFMTLLAAFEALLMRLSGQERFAVAAPSAGRPAPELEDVVGFFVNTLAVPAEPDADAPFTDHLARVRAACIDAYAHDLPYADLSARVQALRGDASALAQAFFSLEQPAPDAGTDGLAALRAGSWMVPTPTSKFDVSLFVHDDGARLRATLEYSTDLFDDAWARRVADGFACLLDAALARPATPVGDLPLQRPAEAEAWLAATDPAPTPIPDEPVHERVRAQALGTPDAVAVETTTARWTYRELDERIDALARRLEARGAGPGVLVGVHLERGMDLVAGLLAVLRTGAAYVPLDPDHPAARTRAVLDDAGVRLVLCGADADLPEHCLRVHADGTEADGTDRVEPRSDLPAGLAYVLHTSGSTGRPKGVLVGHRALSNLIESMRRDLDVTHDDRLLAVTTVSFDIAALELFLPLASGATLHLASREQAADPRLLAPLASAATLMQATPATWRMLVDDGWTGNPGLRALCGGETLPTDLAHDLRERTGRLWNVYGPTETTIWSTLHEVREADGPVPIGRPIANTRVRILDARGNPVPVGVRGELCIAGAGVAEGYLGQPELTNERFVPDPTHDPSGRMYRTGDLARWRPDGTLECLGRMDRQLKVRGFRIEPGEVEHALRALPGVREAVVVAREVAPGDTRLVAYVVADGQDGADGADGVGTDLHDRLRARLPEHMVPGLFVPLDALPLTPNRKVDVAALPAPTPARPAAASMAPRTGTEEALAELWRDLLGVETVGVADDFFRLGGHSLLATRLAARVRSALGVDLPLRDLLAAPTLEAQAALVDATQASTDAEDAGADGEPVLSFQQQRMLFLHGLDPDGAAYNMAVSRRVRGPLDVAALERALQEVVHRHAPLRTVFSEDADGAARAVVQAVERVPVTVVEARDEDEARRVAADEAHRPFDLSTGPLLRATLVRLAPDDQVLLLGVHHVAFDEWSETVLLDDLQTAYAAARAGLPPRFPRLRRTYLQHAAATRSRMESGGLDGELAYWRARLAGLPPLDLPTDRPRPAAASDAGATVPLRVPGPVADRLRSLCHDEGATLHMGLLAAWQALLHRTSGQDDFAVGTPVSGRGDAETDRLVGFFVNTLALRADLDGTPSFRTLLGRTRDTCLEAYRHQEAPLERVVEELGVERTRERSPLFQVAFLLQADEAGEVERDGLLWTPFPLPSHTAKFDLTLALTDQDGDLPGILEYSTDLFDDDTARRMARHLERLLAAMVADPDRPVAHAPLLGTDEEAQLAAWNDTHRPPPEVPVLHRMFEAQAERTPDAVALVQGDERLTYAGLDAAADAFARRLVRRGVARGDLVGISTRRSLDTQTAILGVLKAGAAYLPLDPTYPRERLAFMVEDAAPRLVVTHAELADRLPVDADRLLLVDRPDADGDAATAAPLPTDVSGDELAYVIYTSGSTGRPKGVLLEHRGAANLALAQAELFGPGPGDRVLQFASLSFDASVWEWLMALTTGAALVVPPADLTLAGDDLRDLLESPSITLATLPPSALATLDEDAALPDLHTLIVAGEPCAPPLVRHWSRGRRFVNAYGPTEASVCVTAHFAEDPPRRVLPIGHPLPNMEAHVLDANLRPVPVGVPGELLAGGAGLARGYHNRPELTAEKFVEVDGKRLYRTGDLVRRLPDGQLDFLGRIDHQVKVRGYRIELGEIESALLDHPAVAEAIVVAREDVPGDKRLVAYVTGTDSGPSSAPDAAALRGHLEERLPAHMVPSAIVALEAFPLTPNGKVDRRALPAPHDGDDGPDEDFVAPRTPREAALAEVWREVLRVPRVGVHDNFFALGGDSILSIQVVARAKKRGLALTTRALFDHQTVAELAALAGDEREVQAEQGLVAGAVPLTPIQRWFVERDLPERHHFNQSVLLEVADTVPDDRVEAAVARLLEHHDGLRLRLRPGGDSDADGPEDAVDADGWVQDHVAPDEAGAGAFGRIDLSHLDDPAAQDADLLAACQRAQSTLAPHEGRNLHAVLFDLGADRPRRLLLAVHHNAVDGVSWRILMEDLDALLADDAALPPKTTSFRDWAVRLVEHARTDDALRAELPYWLDQTLDASLPRDHDGENRMEHEEDVTVALDAEDTEALLRDLPRASGARTEEALLAALATALSHWTGQRSVLVEVEGHGREDVLPDVDTNRTVGWFTTTHPLRIDLPDPAGSDAVLDAVRGALRGVPNRGIGHGLLRHLGPDEARAALAAVAPPEVSFNYLGRFDDADGDEPARVRMLDEPHGDDVARRGARHRLLELNGAVTGGRLSMRFSYAATVHDRATVQAVADRFQAALRVMAATWRARAQRSATTDGADGPRRFPLVDASPARIARVLAGRESRVADLYPLTPMQGGMLFHSLREPETGVYVEQSAFLLEGDVEPAALEAAWRSLVARHDILRTAFAWEGLDEPLQLVHHDAALEVAHLDWSDADPAEQEARLDAFLHEDRVRGFDLAHPPLMRVALVRLGPDRHRMVWTNHHALLDGWSLPVLLGELGLAYAAHRDGREPELPPVRPFSSFVAHLRAKPDGAAEAYWRAALEGLDEPTPLPVPDHPAPRHPTAEASLPGEAAATLDAQTLDALQALARRTRVTLNTLLQAAWSVVLARHADRDDVLFGATVSGRPAELDGVESMVGLFINTLPVRVRLPDDAPLAAWLADLQRQHARMREHEHVPLVDVRSWSPLPPGADLFESLLVFENYPWSEGSLQALPITAVKGLSRTNFPLTLVAAPGDGLGLRLFHDADRFAAPEVERVLDRLVRVLEGMARAGPDATVGDMTLVDDAEAERLAAWGATTTHAEPARIPDLVRAQAAARPDAVAVEKGDARLTYAELEARSDAFAAGLAAAGVAPGLVLALAVRPSPDAVAAVLGIHKAGAAYVPLDPDYPAERIAYMLQDSRAGHIVTTRDLAPRFRDAGARLVLLDDETAWSEPPSPDGLPRASPSDLAYLLYTSGSTGRPKGVLVEHRGAAALAAAQQGAFGVGPGSRVLQFASWSFDASVWEMLMALGSGATLCMPPERVAGDALQAYLRSASVHVATLPPTVLRSLDPTTLPDLRVVVSAGEELAPDLRDRWATGRRVFNAYGPTESTVCASVKESLPGEAVTIGRPFAAARVVLLDRSLRPVPAGVAGELCIGGDCLARGYHDRPDLTADRFVADPTRPGDASARLYRTGDLARWNADGELEFLGRIDHQVKVRGHRIECGEVETALRLHEAVEDAFVTARPDPAGGDRLVAYVVGSAVPSASDLREHLARSLPEPMLPSAFVPLDALPLTPNGKVDRKALPDPETAALGDDFVAPRDPVEQILASVWQRVLGVPRVGVHDDFFALGGHSLSATQVVSRVRDALAVEVPLRTLFSARTLEGLADEVRALRSDGAGLALPPVTPHGDDAPAPLSFAQQRLWFMDQWEPGSAVYNIPAFYRLRGALDVRALESALSETIRRHHVLRAVYGVDDEGHPTQTVRPHERLALEVVDLTHLPPEAREAEAQAIAEEESRRPFDLSTGPVYRVRLLRLARDEHWMLLAFHHVAFDGWSMGVLLDEVGRLYASATAGAPPGLPEPEVQYADFARWQRAHLDESVLAPQMRHWRTSLDGVRPLDLPTDRPRPKVQSFRGGHRWFALPEGLSERVKAFGREEGVTLFMPLLAVFETLLHRWSGQDDFAVGTPVAGRTRAETEGLLGFFVNTLVLRADVDGDPTFRELLQKVRARCLDAYANQDVPFEQLVGELHPQRDTSRSPLFQAMFALQEEGLDGARWGPVRVDGVPVSSNASKFDITLFVADAGDRLEGLVEYRSDLFDGETMARLAAQYHALLEAAVSDPDRPLSRLTLLPDDERRLVLDAWNDTARPYPDRHCVHDLFDEQVARTPDAPAVDFDGRTLTYAGLDARARTVAANLAAAGVGPGDTVAVLLERSVDTVAAFVGVLRLGAVYVPLDARHPPERTRFMLEDARVRAVLHHDRLAPRLGDWGGARLDVDRLDPDAPETPAFSARPDAPAYVIYTSGSTGRPKGVLVEHRGACNLAAYSVDTVGIQPGGRVLQYASPAFDVSVLELVGALANGACLVVPTPGDTLAGDDLLRLLQDGRVTFTLLPPAALATLPPDAELPHLERLLTGGDVLPAALARAWAGRVSLANAYGPTEATVATTLCEVPADLEGPPPIGRPLPNVRAYVLDPHLQPVPVGVPGELCLAGIALARGYLDRPELTDDRFVAAPFADERVYRTGDLVRWRPDGQLDFLGRIDHQVKIRGHRIELGEVESALHTHPAVADAVVVAREDEPAARRLVAYVVPRPGPAPTVPDLRTHLGRTLPDVMVPNAVVFLDALPVNTNGKVDRRALPAPEAARPELRDAYVAPRTDTERTLCDAWARALKLERVGVRDNFFDVGGDSILTIRTVALARQAGLRLEPKQLFEHQTVEELAAALDAGATARAGTVVTLHGRGASRPLFLVHAAAGGVTPFASLARALADRPLHAFQAPGIDAGTEPARSIPALARRYVDDMRAVQPDGPYLLGGWSFGSLVAHEMARLLEEDGERVERLVLLEPAPASSLYAPEPMDVDATLAAPLGPDLLETLGLPRDAAVADDEVRRRVLTRAAHLTAIATHRAGTVRAPTALLQTEDTRTRAPGLAATWHDLLASPPDEHVVPGDHDHVVDAQYVPRLAAVLDRVLSAQVTA